MDNEKGYFKNYPQTNDEDTPSQKAYYPHQENWEMLPDATKEEPSQPKEAAAAPQEEPAAPPCSYDDNEAPLTTVSQEETAPQQQAAAPPPAWSFEANQDLMPTKDHPQSEDLSPLTEERDSNDFYATTEEEYYELPVTHQKKNGKARKKHHFGKGFLITCGSLVAVAVIAFSAIGIYTTFFEKEDSVIATQQASTPTVQQTTSTEGGLTVAEINEKVSPAVVGITGESTAGTGTGTGIVISEDGYIMTNAHVVNGFSNLTVTMSDETEHSATLVGLDTQTDIAVIKIDASGLTVAELGDSDALQVGDAVVAIGNPLGLDYAGTVTDGIVSALNREVEIQGATMNYIQTDAAINSGNSGGPLVNSAGQVIGINSAKIESSVAEGMGFAIPINEAIPVVNELIENGYVSGRPMIGISGEDIDEETAAYNHVPTGVYVTAVESGSAAEKAGIQPGMLITAIDDVEIASVADLNAEKNSHEPGDTVTLTVYQVQTGQTSTISVELTEYVPTADE